MKANHVPQAERLQQRIWKLQKREDSCWVKSSRGNPYQKCKHCGIHTPQLSIDGDHFSYCPLRGIEKEIQHYKDLLAQCG